MGCVVRTLSRSFFQQNLQLGSKMLQGSIGTNLACVIQDGMDQAKVKCPKYVTAASKLYSRLFRPMLHLAVSWVHGHKVVSCFFVQVRGAPGESQLHHPSPSPSLPPKTFPKCRGNTKASRKASSPKKSLLWYVVGETAPSCTCT